MQLQPKTLLQGGKYRIEKILGQDAFGITYLGLQVALNRKVAIKEFFILRYSSRNRSTGVVSTPDSMGKYKADFMKKARMAAQLNHPNIVPIHDIFEENGTVYYVTDYIEGGSLDENLKSYPSNRMAEDEVQEVAMQIGAALSFIHSKNICHLDINPGNILVDRKNNRFYLNDFAISLRNKDSDTSSVGPVGFNRTYSPMEQNASQIQLAPTLDIYALGATLYKLLTGMRPPEAVTILNEGFPTTLSKMNISRNMENAVTKAMQPSRKNRPQSVDDFLSLLLGNQPHRQSGDNFMEETDVPENIVTDGAERKYAKALPTGTLLHGNSYTYEIVKVLGQGSFGISYLANVRLSGALGDLQSTVSVAIKEFFMKDVNGRKGSSVTSGSDSEIYRNYRNDFMREANNLSKMRHPHIVKVLEAFEANNTSYFSMEYIDGGNLNDCISQCQSLSEKEALRGIVEIGEALEFMHENKMLHLDLKPLNVMCRKDGKLVLIDFGLSKQFGKNGEPESSTRIGGGTIGYAPLEQANYKKGEGFPATLDIYALGATLFKMLTGKTPADASTIFNEGFPEEELRQCGVSDDVILLVSWAMEPLKRKRPQTVKEFLDEAKRLLPMSSDIKKTREISDSLPKQKTRNVVEGTEQYNGFTINWQKGLKNSQKEAIRQLLESMSKIAEVKEYGYDEYGHQFLKEVYPIMSNGDYINAELHDRILGIEATNGYFGPKHFSVSGAIRFLLKLEQYTGLPFRFSERRKRNMNESTAAPSYWLENPELAYCPYDGFVYTDGHSRRKVTDFLGADGGYCIVVACEGLSPKVFGGRFDVPWTQIIYNKLEPIGFGFYKGELDNRWSIVTKHHTLGSLLQKEYDEISCINYYMIPGRNSFSFGVVAYIDDTIAYYKLEKNKFKLIEEMSRQEREDREMWT